jgi:hypothetical protein
MGLVDSILVFAIAGQTLPLKGPAVLIVCVYIGLYYNLSFVVTEMYLRSQGKVCAAQKRKSIFGTLALPTAATAFDYIHQRVFPYGSFGMLAYSQYGLLPVMQLASIAGIWTITFFMAYVGSSFAFVFSETTGATLKTRLTCAKRTMTIILAVFVFGGARLKYYSVDGSGSNDVGVVRIAGTHLFLPFLFFFICSPLSLSLCLFLFISDSILLLLVFSSSPSSLFFSLGVWAQNTISIRENLLRHHLGLIVDGIPGPGTEMNANWKSIEELAIEDWHIALANAKVEVDGGARIIMLPELALVTFEGEGFGSSVATKEELFPLCAKFARDNDVFLGIGVGINEPFKMVEGLSEFTKIVLESPDGMQGVESNRFILFGPSRHAFDETVNGKQLHEHIAIDYRKMNPVPIIETPFGSPGNVTIPTAALDIFGDGRELIETGTAVCFDMEHPTHIQQLGKRTNFILNPSYDWPGLNPYHARIVAFRAIENGANIFHHW